MTEGPDSTELAAELAIGGLHDDAIQAGWRRHVAFGTLVIAVLAAISALFGGVTSHEILIERTEEIVDVVTANNHLLRAEVIRANHVLLAQLGADPDPAEVAEVDALEAEANLAIVAAEDERTESFAIGSAHLAFAAAATLFAVSIAIAGLALIMGNKKLWFGSLTLTAVGLVALSARLVGFYS